MSLQTVLIIIGSIVIALIYIATRLTFRASMDKNKASFSKTVEEREFVGSSEGDILTDERHIQSQLDLELSEDPQLGLFESSESNSQCLSEPVDLTEENETIETFPQDGPEILKVFLKPREGGVFQGMDILRSLNHVGMVFGEMDIFHKTIDDGGKSVKTLFRAANMFEPGSFNLQKIEAENCRGLVFFMELPTVIDDGVALETLLTTTERLAKLLDGLVYKTPEELMDTDFLDALRLKTNFIIDND